jgi:hypothetical protein
MAQHHGNRVPEGPRAENCRLHPPGSLFVIFLIFLVVDQQRLKMYPFHVPNELLDLANILL